MNNNGLLRSAFTLGWKLPSWPTSRHSNCDCVNRAGRKLLRPVQPYKTQSGALRFVWVRLLISVCPRDLRVESWVEPGFLIEAPKRQPRRIWASPEFSASENTSFGGVVRAILSLSAKQI